MSLTYIIKIVPINTNEPNANVGTFRVMRSHFIYLFGSLQEVLEVTTFFLTAEIGSAAGVTSYPPQLLSIDTVGEVADDILNLFKDFGLELHYFVHSLRPDTDIKAR